MRRPTQPIPRNVRLEAVEPAVRGLVFDRSVMAPEKGSAEALENWIPTQRGMRVRGGLQASGKLPGAVTSLFTYEAGVSSKMFAASADCVYDVSGISGDTLALSGGFCGQTAGYYSTAQIGTSGGNFLYAVNGADLAWLYDGGEWNPIGSVTYNEIAFDWLSADWAVGDTVTGGSSGATADIVAIEKVTEKSGRIIVGTITGGPFTSGEEITATGANFGRNVLTYSQDISNASWTKYAGIVSADSTTAPDGTTTADTFTEAASTDQHRFVKSYALTSDGETWTFSVYLKTNGRPNVEVYFDGAGIGVAGRVEVNLTTGDITPDNGTPPEGYAIEDAGSGWWRVSVTDQTIGANISVQVRLLDGPAGNVSYLGDGSSGIYVWGAQLEEGDRATNYEPTVAAARTDTRAAATANSAAASSVAITGVATTALSAVWLYRNRLFFVEKNTLKAWYLPVAAVGGAASDISFAGVFKRGGSLLFGATWSLDSGDGLDDKCVFVSTNGEVAVYEGSDPSSSTTWNLVGRYDTAKPLGINATMQAGGDLLIATVDGIIPLSQIIQKDPAALSLSAVTRRIEPLWMREAQNATSPVELLKWSDEGLGLVTLPDSDQCLIANLQTGAWATATGWVANCATTYAGRAFIGRADGRVLAIDESGLDYDQPFVARYCGPFFDFGDPLSYKQGLLMRVAYFAPYEVTFRMSMSSDYEVGFPSAPAGTNATGLADYLVWDVGNWDEKVWWDESVEENVKSYLTAWRTVTKHGTVLAPCLQVTSGKAAKVTCEVARVDMGYEAGRIVA